MQEARRPDLELGGPTHTVAIYWLKRLPGNSYDNFYALYPLSRYMFYAHAP